MAKFGPKAIKRWTKRALRPARRVGTLIAKILHPISRNAPAFNPLSPTMRMGPLATRSPGLWRALVIGVPEDRWEDLNIALPEFKKLFVSISMNPDSVAREVKQRKPDAVIVWGFSSNRIIQRLDVQHDIRLPLVHVYQSPLDDSRSSIRGLSVDWSGSWVNSRRSSDLEDMLNYLPTGTIETELLWADKYISTARASLRTGDGSEDRILLITQDSRDPVLRLGVAKPMTVPALIDRISNDFPGAKIDLLPTSPHDECDNIPDKLQLPEHVNLLDRSTKIDTALRSATRVCTVSSPLGMQGLLADLPVTVYGAPFYAGWGLTDDRNKLGRRQRELSLDQLIAISGPIYSRWIDRKQQKLAMEPALEDAA